LTLILGTATSTADACRRLSRADGHASLGSGFLKKLDDAPLC
jgi:hypothetical protein